MLAATNRPNSVDAAVLRRLPLSFEVSLPGEAARRDVLTLLLRGEPTAEGLDIAAIAAATDGYSGSDLEQARRSHVAVARHLHAHAHGRGHGHGE